MRSAIVLVLTVIVAGCAYMPTNVTRIQMTARDGGTVYSGIIKRTLPAVVNITVEVDRRVYYGNFELTYPNETFGLYQVYGLPRDAAPATAQPSSRTNYSRAILSSSDQRILRCDFTDDAGRDARGLCVDEASRVYDVTMS
jgi:hypothetical protein